MPLISVILPVYNSEKYLAQTLNCLFAQSFKDFEIIAINDGSKDNSEAILQDYAQKDTRLKIINQQNAGQNLARQTGIKAATGDFIAFCDDDDLMLPTTFERMVAVQKETNADLVCHAYKRIGENVTADELPVAKKSTIKIAKGLDSIRKKEVNIMPWSKLYRRSLFEGKSFPALTLGEDFYTTFVLFMAAKKTVYITDKLYFHRQHDGQQSGSLTTKKIQDNFKAAHLLTDIITENHLSSKDCKAFARYSARSQLFSLFTQIMDDSNPELKQVFVDEWKSLFAKTFINLSDLTLGRRFVMNAILKGNFEVAKKRLSLIKKIRI
ncbi:MAG: glycosyltransferase [Alphaproteobacteria bacterium]|nr:glycosyltransferase [Alphaproteobacteria bacterium]